ncbi:MAG: efflux RND transporter periplasmic adaptor subunit [Chitinophagales bacterium]|nr:efflux RND transporter periplasmic adaptor subunit [Chitinophagales bacterium]
MNPRTRKILFILLGVVILLVVISSVGKSKGWFGAGKPSEVTVATITKHDISETVTGTGKIYPQTEIKISPDVSGEITSLPVEEGDSVKAGALVVKIRPDIYESMVNQAEASVNQAKSSLANSKAMLSQAQAQFDNAQTTFQRNEQLYKQKVLSEAEYQNAVAAYKTAQSQLDAAKQNVVSAEFSVKGFEASLKEARDNLYKTTIYAPSGGIISMLAVEVGERVVGTTQMAGTEIMRISDLNNMEVRVDVSESDILRLSLGDTANIEVDAYQDRVFKGIVTHIANSATATNQLTSESVTNFTVKIALLKSSYQDLITKNNKYPFKPGMSASVEVLTERADDVLAVPLQAVTLDNSDDKKTNEIVFLFNQGKAQKVIVTTGIQDDRVIQIKKGLQEGQQVITGPYALISKELNDGDPIKILVEKASDNRSTTPKNQ